MSDTVKLDPQQHREILMAILMSGFVANNTAPDPDKIHTLVEAILGFDWDRPLIEPSE